MVYPTQNWNRDHLVALVMRGSRRHRRVWKLLLDALMWSGLIEVHYICVEETVELLLMQDQEVIKAFSPDAAQKALTDGICSWSLKRRSKHFDATGCCHTCKTRPEFAIVISNQIPGSFPIRSRLSQLLGHPAIGRRLRHPHMDDLPRLQFNDEKRQTANGKRDR